MEVDRSIRKTDRIVVFVMVVVLVGCGVIGFSTGSQASLDTSAWFAAVSDAEWPDGSTQSPFSEDGKRVAQAATTDWFAADSPQETRPESAH